MITNKNLDILTNLTDHLMLTICYYINDDDIINIGENIPVLLENRAFKKEYKVCKENKHVYNLMTDPSIDVGYIKDDKIFAKYSYYILCSASYNGCYFYDPIYRERQSKNII